MEEMIRYRSETEKMLSKGEFKCAYDREMIYLAIIGVILIVSLIVALPVIFYIIGFMGRRGRFDALIVMLIPFYLIFGSLFAAILNGRTCHYDAGEKEFIITGPGKRKEFFYYDDVQDIRTEELKLFGKKRGYIVTVTTGVRDIEYRYIFGKNKVFTGIDATPFYYLGLNSGLYVKTRPNLDNNMDTDDINMMFESMMVEQITRKNMNATETDGMASMNQIRRDI